MVTTQFEQHYWNRGVLYIAGVDEAGRGPLAGPVVAAAVVFRPDTEIPGIDDSKKLSWSKRIHLFEKITAAALSIGVSSVNENVIDEINILQATFKAMHDAITQLRPVPDHLLIDGNRFKENGIPFQTIVGGDARCASIAAASIIAKVTRDRIMEEYDKEYPGYGFAQHKGYGTKAHLAAIREHGLCEIHRKSFHVRPKQMFLFEKK